MLLCANCLAVARDASKASGHLALHIIDTRRSKLPRAATVTISTFRCSDCGVIWRYREAKDSGPQGWSQVLSEEAGGDYASL
ncbi:hypothetical protein C2U69_21085 [Cupriavidus pinatubonensis]|nr:hypothetical protein C2U69_21085 [Cupriavidus pinatubonensis]